MSNNRISTRSVWPGLVQYILYTILFASMVLCWRAVSSSCIGLLLVAGLLKNKSETGKWISSDRFNPFFIACSLLYVLQLVVLPFSSHMQESLKNAQIKSGLLFIPLALCCTNFLTPMAREKLMKYYTWILATALLYCLLLGSVAYTMGKADAGIFFYHQLVLPFQQHAVQFSILVFMVLLYLLEKAANKQVFYTKTIHLLLVLFFTGCLLLLSSKLVISFALCCLAWYCFRILQAFTHTRVILFAAMLTVFSIILLVLFTPNRINRRFNEILTGKLAIVEQPHFNAGMYFNGLQFRLLEWRFVQEILSEQRSWLTGVGSQAQPLLDKKYASTGMYTGDAHTESRGYLSYNTHNQFLQSLLQSGIPGLLLFIASCCTMVWMGITRQQRELTLLVLLLLAYCFNEAVFETQYGLTLFTFLPLFVFYGSVSKSRAARETYPGVWLRHRALNS